MRLYKYKALYMTNFFQDELTVGFITTYMYMRHSFLYMHHIFAVMHTVLSVLRKFP